MKRFNIILSGTFGNALEWYDFTSYAFFVPILSQLFFPTKNHFLSLLLTFSVFAMSFLVRPIGGLLIGYLGDRRGRKFALILSIIAMSCATFLFGLLPTFDKWGYFASILLIILRLIQGMAVSGEFTTSISFMVEHAQADRRGLMASLVMFSALFGIALSSAVATLLTETLSAADLHQWGWRLPFLLGGLLGLIGVWLRFNTVETEHFKKIQIHLSESQTYFLWRQLFVSYRGRLIAAVLLTCAMAVGNYYIIAYFVTFLTQTEHLPVEQVMIVNLIALILLTILIPFYGFLSDLWGRKKVFYFGLICLAIVSYPSFWLLSQGNIYSAFWGQILFAFFQAALGGVVPIMLAELFPTAIRNTGLSLGYNLSLAIFGGTAPMMGLLIVQETGLKTSPAFYLIICCVVSLVALAFQKESYTKPLH